MRGGARFAGCSASSMVGPRARGAISRPLSRARQQSTPTTNSRHCCCAISSQQWGFFRFKRHEIYLFDVRRRKSAMADPLSVAASLLAVLGAAQGTAGGLEQMLALRHAPKELLAVINEVQIQMELPSTSSSITNVGLQSPCDASRHRDFPSLSWSRVF